MNIIDRRLNPGGKSLANRQRFIRRAKAVVQQAVRKSTQGPQHQGFRPGRGGLDPDRQPPGAPPAPLLPGRRCARTFCRATRSSSRATPSRGPRRAVAAPARRAATTARGRTISASCCRRKNISTCSSRISNCRTSPRRSSRAPKASACTGPAIRCRARPPTCRSPAPCATACRGAWRCGGPSSREIEALELEIEALAAGKGDAEPVEELGPRLDVLQRPLPSASGSSIRSTSATGASSRCRSPSPRRSCSA